MENLTLENGPVEYFRVPGGSSLSPMVMLHEGLGSAVSWGAFPRRLARLTGRDVVSYSRYGYGGSGPCAVPRSKAFLHDEAMRVLPELIDRLRLVRPVLVGHCDGASIGIIHAGSGRADLSGLILLAPHSFIDSATRTRLMALRQSFADGELASRLALYHPDPAGVFRPWSDIWTSEAFQDFDISAYAERIDCPVLVMQGVEDQAGTMAQLDLLQARVPSPVTRIDLEACGHDPHLEMPDAVEGYIAKFLLGMQ
ncbi:alpha/beta fold hydrolase [Streptomyces sp. DH37]|uniref:alpha/beta fold hydrolase n=1 Tax=Streptomyces sp. DH37 TaxID=3040122 RepID=UPI0024411326|nr:alpha/beta hydrolase [Streptomyces sp. DH37]MDG9702875.1 alpha/beta hydrolase [Streptomyces sp. DH37]